jgi:hypothetical protein
MTERENRDTTATARSLSVVHQIERDQDAAATLVAGLVDRGAGAGERGGPTFLALLPSADEALSFCEAVLSRRRDQGPALSPITSVARGRRILGAGAGAIAASPAHIAALIAESRPVLTKLHTLVLVWPEETLTDDEQRPLLESVLAEVPRTTERVAISADRTTELGAFLERSMWRARTIDHVVPAVTSSAALRVIATVPAERVRALRSVLDAFDPRSAVLVTFSDDGEAAARDAARLLGAGDDLLQVSRGVPEGRFNLGVIFDDTPTAESLGALSDAVDELVAIVRPSRLTALRKVAPHLTAIAWTGAVGNARSAHDALRDEIRGFTVSGAHAPWIPIIEPLLEGLDSVEVAAAALALLDRERRKAKRLAQAPQAQASAPDRQARPERSPRPARPDDRAGRPERGAKRPFDKGAGARRSGDDRPGPRRDRGDRPAREERGGGRSGRPRDEIERVPRAAREGREWSERGERLRNSRRGPRDGEPG